VACFADTFDDGNCPRLLYFDARLAFDIKILQFSKFSLSILIGVDVVLAQADSPRPSVNIRCLDSRSSSNPASRIALTALLTAGVDFMGYDPLCVCLIVASWELQFPAGLLAFDGLEVGQFFLA
jgi:hypothetical protein